MDRAEAEAIYDSGREACVQFILDLANTVTRREDRLKRLEERSRQDSRTSSKPPSGDPPKTRSQRRAEARAKAKELMRREGERRKAGGQPGHRGAGRDLKPEDQVDEIVDHYPDVCGGCGRQFDEGQREPGGRFSSHQVCELPPISVIVTEHRTHQLRCRDCRARTSARLPDLIRSSPFGAGLQAAVVTLTARHRVSRRGICELARDLFGVTLCTGAVDGICQRASDALAGPHCQLQDWVLDQGAVHVDETGWRTRGEGRALWTATTPQATFLQIAEHCNREQFDALIGPYAGIVVSDRWNGFSHLEPHQRQVCWSHLQRDFRRHADGLGEQKTFGERGLELTAACSLPGAPTSTSATTATDSEPNGPHRRPSYANCSNTPARRADAPAGTGGSRTTCSRSGPRSGPSPSTPRPSRRITRPSARSEHRSSTEKSRWAPKATTASDSPNARSRPPPPAASSAARCSRLSPT